MILFFREGSNLTPAHHYSDFRFKTYAPIAFRYFRELFSIQTDDFLVGWRLSSIILQYTGELMQFLFVRQILIGYNKKVLICINPVIKLLNNFVSSCSCRCVTSRWRSFRTRGRAAASSTWVRTTSSSSRQCSTRRRTSYRNCCPATTWWGSVNTQKRRMGGGGGAVNTKGKGSVYTQGDAIS